jgi:hypothetical protein
MVVPAAIVLTTVVGWSPARVLLLAAAVGFAWPARPVEKRAT